MVARYIKIGLVGIVGLNGFLWVIANLTNWDAGISTVAYVLSMEGHEAYGNHIFFPVTSPLLTTVGFCLILTGEFLVGALSFKGAWDLWVMRNGPASEFNQAKTFSLLGPAMAVAVWFGGFIVIGGALFQMWQTQIGAGSFRDAFVFSAMAALILIFVNTPDE